MNVYSYSFVSILDNGYISSPTHESIRPSTSHAAGRSNYDTHLYDKRPATSMNGRKSISIYELRDYLCFIL